MLPAGEMSGIDADPRRGVTEIRRAVRLRASLTGYALAMPAGLLLAIVILMPIVAVILLSFSDYTLGALDWEFIGLSNYRKLLSDAVFWRSIRNTFFYVAIVVPGSVGLGLLLALLVHQRTRTRRLYEIVFFLPVTGTLVAMAIVWQFLLHSRVGPVNLFLLENSFERIGFFTDPRLAMLSLSLIGIWQLAGFNMILFLAGLSAIPKDIYDAAALDGIDGGVDRLVRITWPLLGPTTMFVTITTSITAFQVFDTVAVLTRGGPRGSTDVLLYQAYLEGFQYFEIGYAACLTVVFLVFILLFSLMQVRFFDKRVHY
ncbi:carbohydrate ABC transporter permease [Roseibium aggregatum]|uniref:carbohydrate ABC transporter permease n=1 Tax=Roseibium aggregatum TaxID=187304 RepID=UPI001E447725|nr:sugar ABC transporter permease [Roseibium aggregatum]